MSNYPEEFPINEVKSIVEFVRNKSIKDNLADFAHDLWVLQGFAQKSLIGQAGPDFSLSVQSAPEDFCAIETLEKAIASIDSNEISAQIAIPWQLILQWAISELMKALDGK